MDGAHVGEAQLAVSLMGRAYVPGVAGEFRAMSRKLMFVVNVDWFFMPYRLPIALQAWAEGYEVHVDEASFRTQSSICTLGSLNVPGLG